MNDEILKKNIIKIVKEHKESCDNSECGIFSCNLYLLLNKAGIYLSREEAELFF